MSMWLVLFAPTEYPRGCCCLHQLNILAVVVVNTNCISMRLLLFTPTACSLTIKAMGVLMITLMVILYVFFLALMTRFNDVDVELCSMVGWPVAACVLLSIRKRVAVRI